MKPGVKSFENSLIGCFNAEAHSALPKREPLSCAKASKKSSKKLVVEYRSGAKTWKNAWDQRKISNFTNEDRYSEYPIANDQHPISSFEPPHLIRFISNRVSPSSFRFIRLFRCEKPSSNTPFQIKYLRDSPRGYRNSNVIK